MRDALAYLRLIAQGDDDLARLSGSSTKPKRGIGDASVAALHAFARVTVQIPLLAAAREMVETDELPPKARKALESGKFGSQFRPAGDETRAKFCLMPSWRRWCWMSAARYTEHAQGRQIRRRRRAGWTIWKELVRSMEAFESLERLALEHVSLW